MIERKPGVKARDILKIVNQGVKGADRVTSLCKLGKLGVVEAAFVHATKSQESGEDVAGNPVKIF